ncbi:MAG TPA: PKD domain-containing protein [Jatrophihabitantaceae bacterium]
MRASVSSHAGATVSSPRPAATTPSGPVRYAVGEPLCAQPKNPYAIRCFAMKRVNVAKGTPGAFAYSVRPDYATGPAGGFTPGDIATAYGVNPASGGGSQTVGIIDWNNDPHALSDLNTFDRHYGLPTETSTSFRKVNQNGATSPLPSNTTDTGEISLDIESVRAVCNHCKILLVEATAAYDSDLATAENTAVKLGATEVSNSFGGPEDPNSPRSNAVLKAYNHPGVPIMASTGDNGWFDWDFANDGNGSSDNAPNFPSSSPNVVAVGGTALALNSNGTRQEEDVWNENGADDDNAVFDGEWIGGAMGASGGGCSTTYTATTWQQQVAGYTKTGCGGKRMTGDIAALADPYTGFDIYDTYSHGWITIGGTSLASPLIAGMWALAGGDGGAVSPSQALYTNFTNHPSSLYDVWAGGNGWCAGDDSQNCAAILSAESNDGHGHPGNGNPNGLNDPAGDAGGEKDCSFPRDGSTLVGDPFSLECNADYGYDGPSGVGVPTGLGVFAPTNPKVTITLPSSPKHGKKLTVTATGTSRVGAQPTKYVFDWGNGTTSTKSTGSASHTYSKAGTYLVKVTVTDSAGQKGFASKTLVVK